MLPPVCDKFFKEYVMRVMTRLAVARMADLAQGNKLLSDEHRELRKEAGDQGFQQTWDEDAWGVVLEHLDKQMLDPEVTGTPDHIKTKLKDLFKTYACYNKHFEALLPDESDPCASLTGLNRTALKWGHR